MKNNQNEIMGQGNLSTQNQNPNKQQNVGYPNNDSNSINNGIKDQESQREFSNQDEGNISDAAYDRNKDTNSLENNVRDNQSSQQAQEYRNRLENISTRKMNAEQKEFEEDNLVKSPEKQEVAEQHKTHRENDIPRASQINTGQTEDEFQNKSLQQERNKTS